MSSPTPSSPTHTTSRSPSPPPAPFSLLNPRPDLPPGLAAEALRKLVAHELVRAGFESCEQDALEELEGCLFSFFEAFLIQSHELANHARRTRPNFKDLVSASATLGVGGSAELLQELGRGPTGASDISIRYERARIQHTGPTLASDDEDSGGDDEFDEVDPAAAGAISPQKKRRTARDDKRKKLLAAQLGALAETLDAPYLPPLPVKHSYMQTPVYPQSAIPPPVPPSTSQTQQAPSAAALKHLSTLGSRLNDSQLVASSLRNLIRRTSARHEAEEENNGEGADVVSYEGEWYGARGHERDPRQGDWKRRRVAVLRVATSGDQLGKVVSGLLEDEGAESSAAKVGGAGMRRKWRA